MMNSEKKKVCFFSGDISRSGGTERVAVQLVNALSEDKTVEVCFLSLIQQHQPFYPINKNINTYHLEQKWVNPGLGYLFIIPKLKKFLITNKIDIIVDIDIVLDVLSLPASRQLCTKVISWEHFTADFEMSVWYRRLILSYSVKRSDYVVVLTKNDLESYETCLKRNKNISQIYNPVENDMFKTSEIRIRKKQIVTVGRLVPEKGIEYLKTIALEILKLYPDWKWFVLGEGIERANLEQFIKENSLQERLILEGDVKNVAEWLMESQVLVSVSKYEGLGMSILEARAAGVPCISFAVRQGPKEIIHDGEDGFLVLPFDCHEMVEKIGILLDNEALRNQFSQKAFSYMDEFKIDNVLQKWKKILK